MRPYTTGVMSDGYDSVNMVGHDYERIHYQGWSYNLRPEPFGTNDYTVFVQHHFSIRNFPKQMLPPIGADRDEECRTGGIIKPLQAWGFAALPHRKTSPGFIRSALKSGSSEASITTSRLIADTHRKSEGRIATGSRVRKYSSPGMAMGRQAK